MAPILKGGLSITSTVNAGDKFRVTWQHLGATWLPNFLFNAPAVADQLRVALPSWGFVAVSNPSASAGDEVIVYDVRVTSTFDFGYGQTVAAIVRRLDGFPATLTPIVLERIAPSTSSAALQSGLASAVKTGNAIANGNNIVEGVVGSVLSSLVSGVGAVVAVVALGAVVYFGRRS